MIGTSRHPDFKGLPAQTPDPQPVQGTDSSRTPALASGGELHVPEGSPQTAGDALRRAANFAARGIGYVDGPGLDRFQSYADLLDEALRIAGGLRARGLDRGDPVIFQLERASDFIPVLWACLIGGQIAVPVTVASVFSGESANLRKLRNIFDALGRPPIVADGATAAALAGVAGSGLDPDRIVMVEALRVAAAGGALPEISPDDAAIIFYTSGSTGSPKGVAITHRNVLSMAAGSAQMNRFDADDVALNWMPLDHVGAVVFLGVLPVWLAATQIHVPTKLIVQQPLLWLDLIARKRASISWAPNFAFDLVNRCQAELGERDFDLSSMRFLVNAGEQVAPRTVEAFLEILERHRLPRDALRPAFGMSETCSGITWSSGLTRDRLREGLSYVSLGSPIPGASLRITDEDGATRAEGEIGRLEIRGPSVTCGYHNSPDRNAEAFTADGWFRSGDLGFIANGELHITGREKDEIIVNGVNIPAHEIEAAVEAVEGVTVSFTCAFAVAENGKPGEQLAVVFHPETAAETEWAGAVARIRRHLAQTLGVTPAFVVPLGRDAIPRTAIGKIQRSRLKRAFEDGEFAPILEQFDRIRPGAAGSPAETPHAGIENEIAAIWRSVLDLKSIGRNDNFFDLGGQSILLIKVHARLEARFGPLPLAELFNHPSIAAQANYFGGAGNDAGEEEQRQARVARRRSGTRETDIAVIAMACRFPGADSIAEFWRNLCDGVESIRFFSDAEIAAAHIDPASARHRDYVKASSVLNDAAGFDAGFFGFSDREAENMDPQHRVFLECCWEVMEAAGYDSLAYPNAVGLYAGAAMNTYLLNNVLAHRRRFDAHDDLRTVTLDSMGGFQLMVANDKDYLNTRVSYKLNLRGPSLNIQTACSTGLVVIHQAAQSLIAGECDMAIAGTASIQSPPTAGHLYQEGMIVSPDGHCRAFDAKARGTIFGSGVGCVLLKRLSEARRDGDRILAVVKGSAVNNDGLRKVGYMAPSESGESEVAREALEVAGVDAATVGFVEAHGTGTEIGDPIEVAGLTRAFRADTERCGYCAIGSVKTNVGHLQITSGIAGFIKAVLALHHGRIPPTLHFKEPNPAIRFARTPFYVNTALAEWPAGDTPRRAGVNSLGIGGTNAHVILEEAPPPARAAPTFERPWLILALSARDTESRNRLVGQYRSLLENDPGIALEDLCYTANTGRHDFEHRFAAVFASREDLLARLAAPGPDMAAEAAGGIAFLFTGQGAQYVGMARGLYDTEPVFRAALDRCAEIASPELDRPLLDILYRDDAADSPLGLTLYTQPALFALEYALAQLWLSFGVSPSALIGHSVGEYVAACVAGVFTLEDGLKLIAARARLMQALPAEGAMVAVMTEEPRVSAAIAKFAERVSIAAVNGPNHVVISGARDAIAALVEEFEEQDIETVALKTSHAFHSPLMRPMLAAFRDALEATTLREPAMTLVSNVTGRVETALFTDPDYWLRHVVEPVNFAAGLTTVVGERGCRTLLELGPKPVLLGIARTNCAADPPALLASLRAGIPDTRQILESLAELYRRGHAVQWSGLYEPAARQRLALPTYPFQHKRYWLAPGTSAAPAGPAINRRIPTPGLPHILFGSVLDPQQLPLLEQHRVFDRIVMAGAGHVALVLAAAAQTLGGDAHALSDIVFPEALVLQDGESGCVQVQFTPEAEGFGFRLVGFESEADATRHRVHATGKLAAEAVPDSAPISLTAWRARCTEQRGRENLYERLAARQIALGPHFSWVHNVWAGDGEALFELRRPDGVADEAALPFHPGLLDSMLQPALLVLQIAGSGETPVPFALQSFRVFRRPLFPLWGHVRRRSVGASDDMADITVVDRDGATVAEIRGLEMRGVNPATLLRSGELRDALYEVAWRPLPGGASAPATPSLSSQMARADLKAGIGDLLDEVNSEAYRQRSHDLETLGLVFIDGLLRAERALPLPGRPLSEDEIARRLGIAPHYRQLLARLLCIMETHGRFSRRDGNWEGRSCPPLPDRAAQIERIRAGHGESVAAELALLCRCGEQLREIMQGEADPLEALFPGGDLTPATRLYQDSAGFRALNILVANIVETLKTPEGRPLRVLEIGAGTGATSHYVLSRLDPENATYCFSDISRLFLVRAQEKFADYGFVDYRVLDIERNPREQGFEEPFDLVIAANVLHATRDIGETLAHVRQMLRPGGHLVLLEVNAPTVPVDLTFGLLEGWWRFADRDLRPDYPLLSRDQWRTQLGEHGFGEVVVADITIPSPGGLQSVFVARAGTPASDLWAILADRGGLGEALSRALEARGHRTRLVPFDADIGTANLEGDRPRGIVHLRGLDDAGDEQPFDLRSGCGTILELARERQHGRRLACPLYLVSRGATPASQPAVASHELPLQSALWGLGRVLFQEHPELAGALIDLDPAATQEANAQALAGALYGDPEERELALRGGQFLGARLVRSPQAARMPATIRADGAYLITGGLGGLGLRLARELAERGARHIALVGRSAPDADAGSAIEAMRESGALIQILQADVTDEAAVARVLDAVSANAPLRGVFHLAGVLDDGALELLAQERFADAVAAKIRGAWYLDRLTRGLDHFVMFSSAAGLLGLPGQASYAAANAFLDGLAHHRRARGEAALSIDWGRWSELGMVAGEAERLAREGFGAIAPRDGMALLFECMAADAVQSAVLPVQWERLAARLRPLPALLREIAQASARARPAPGSPPRNADPAVVFAPGTPLETREALTDYLAGLVQQVTGTPSPPQPEPTLTELGLDSLMNIDLRNRIARGVGITLPLSVLVNANIGQLARDLHARLHIVDRADTADAAVSDLEEEILL